MLLLEEFFIYFFLASKSGIFNYKASPKDKDFPFANYLGSFGQLMSPASNYSKGDKIFFSDRMGDC